MTEVHWDNNNYFIHYGGAGLDMFHMVGYDPDHDSVQKGQFELGFEFDDVARNASIASLVEQIPRLIYANDEIGRAHVWTPVTLIYLVCRLLLEKKK